MQDYRRLRVWRKAHALTLNVRQATRKFPRTGYASLIGQLTRSAESIPFNIVEGCGATSQKEFARFLDISIKSTFELQYQLRLARDYELLSHREWNDLSRDDVDVRRMLCGLRRKVLATDASVSISHGKTDNAKTVNS
jgi:four helix bundle protein